MIDYYISIHLQRMRLDMILPKLRFYFRFDENLDQETISNIMKLNTAPTKKALIIKICVVGDSLMRFMITEPIKQGRLLITK
jgi:hypothetical protein